MKTPLTNKLSATLLFSLLLVVIVLAACQSAPADTTVVSDTQEVQESSAVVANLNPATENAYPAPLFITSLDCAGLQHGVLPFTELTISYGENDIIKALVEVADEATERSQGLMCRESIPPGTGMLFTYDKDRSSGFWMFNTYAPIDILYLDQSGGVIDNITMSPCTRGSDIDDVWRNRCALEANDYVPSGLWRNTLELPAGWLEDQGLDGTVTREMSISWTTVRP